MAASVKVIARQGLGAPTSLIASEACVANGSLFTYFETKTDLFNQLYRELKTEMAEATVKGLPAEAGLREQFFHIWSHWMAWAVSNPDKQRTLAYLGVSDEIAPESRIAGHRTMAGIADLIERIRIDGSLRDAPMGLLVAIMNALAEATAGFMAHDPEDADRHCATGFEALWRVLA